MWSARVETIHLRHHEIEQGDVVMHGRRCEPTAASARAICPTLAQRVIHAPQVQLIARASDGSARCRRPPGCEASPGTTHHPSETVGVSLAGAGKREPELRALAERAAEADLTAHQLHQAFADDQTQAGAAELARGRRIGL